MEQVPPQFIDPARRAQFRSEPEALFEKPGLTGGDERHLVRTLDWRGTIHHGVSHSMVWIYRSVALTNSRC